MCICKPAEITLFSEANVENENARKMYNLSQVVAKKQKSIFVLAEIT
jgi:hypothetical protein